MGCGRTTHDREETGVEDGEAMEAEGEEIRVVGEKGVYTDAGRG